MATASAIQTALSGVHDLTSLRNDFLVDTFRWRIEERPEDPEQVTYGWTAEEQRMSRFPGTLIARAVPWPGGCPVAGKCFANGSFDAGW